MFSHLGKLAIHNPMQMHSAPVLKCLPAKFSLVSTVGSNDIASAYKRWLEGVRNAIVLFFYRWLVLIVFT